MPCPEADELLALSTDGEAAARDHIRTCPRCQEQVAQLKRELFALRRAAPGFLVRQPASEASTVPPSTSEPVLGNYVILEKLGQGGMGQVFKARHKRMDRLVALKILPAGMRANDAALARFEREAKAAGRLSHPNIATAHDADEANGVQFLVMEYVEGRDLGSVVREGGRLAIDTAVRYAVQAAAGLEYIHCQGIVHRDVKPANLLVDDNGRLTIVDLGVARFQDELARSSLALTKAGDLMGTADFLAPEQAADSHTADARSDIYSLGCTLYYLLTGAPPYQGDSLMSKLLAHREQPIPSCRAERPEVPERLDLLVGRMMAKLPADRFSTMGRVSAALVACAPEDTASWQPDTVPASARTDSVAASRRDAQRIRRPPIASGATRRPKGALVVGMIGLMSLAVITSLVAWRNLTPVQEASQGNGVHARSSDTSPAKEKQGGVYQRASVTETENANKGVAGGAVGEPVEGAPVAQPAPSGSIDVLALIDPIRDGIGSKLIHGEWTKAEGALVSTIEGCGLVQAPHALPADYRVTLEVQRTADSGGHGLVLGLAVGGVKLPLLIDYCPDGNSFLTGFEGQLRSGALLELGRKSTLTCEVQENGVQLFRDGELVFNWRSDQHLARIADSQSARFWSDPVPSNNVVSLGYSGRYGQWRVTRFEIEPISPEAAPPTVPEGQAIALPPIGDVARYQLDNEIRTSSGDHLSTGEGSVVQIPVDLPNEYVVSFDVQTASPTSSLTLYGLCSGRRYAITLDGDGDGKTGLAMPLGAFPMGESTALFGQALSIDKPNRVAIAVRSNSLLVAVDGRSILAWEGDPSELGVWPHARELCMLREGRFLIQTPTPVLLSNFSVEQLSNERRRGDAQGYHRFRGPHNRDVAEWVFTRGGSVTVSVDGHARDLYSKGELPAEEFTCTGINLDGAPLVDADMERFKDLSLSRLVLSNNPAITDACLARIPTTTMIAGIWLVNTGVTDIGLATLAKNEGLTQIWLNDTHVDGSGLQHIARSGPYLISLDNTRLTDANLRYLSALPQLHDLSIAGTSIGDQGVQHVAGLARLWSLDLSRTSVSDAGLVHLKDKSSLQTLRLNNTQITDATLKHLAGLTGLRQLSLAGNQVTDQHLDELARLSHLEQLELNETRVTDAGLAHVGRLAQLRELNAGLTQITGSGLAYLAGCSSLETLALMSPIETGLTASGLTQLARLTQLRDLHLIGPVVTDRELACVDGMLKLQRLNLLHTSIDGTGLSHLKDARELRFLHVGHTALTDEGLGQLRALPALTELHAYDTRLTDGAVAILSRMPALVSVHLDSTFITRQGIEALRQAKPNLKIIWEEPDSERRAAYWALRRTMWGGLLATVDGADLPIDHAGLIPAAPFSVVHINIYRNQSLVRDDDLLLLGRLRRLRELFLPNTTITDNGMTHLKGNAELQVLDLSGTLITDTGLDSL
ncbi:MAG: protein kinase, partial [Pirellulales bacterium]